MKPGELLTFYINNAQFAQSQWDLRIDLNEIQDADVGANVIRATHRVRLHMSWQFAQVFVEVMRRNIESYGKKLEEQFESLQKEEEKKAEQ
ncbi:MAG TPA: DUF3467 domain-containing protein [Acidobacteriota bacterium]